MRQPLSIARLALALAATAAVGSAAAAPPADIVIRASDLSQATLHGAWTLAADGTSSDGIKLAAWRGFSMAAVRGCDDGGCISRSPAAAPDDYVDVWFNARAGTTYRLWLRLRNVAMDGRDSVWVQFSDATVNGSSAYAIDTTTALLVTLQGCPGCATSGWGWRDSSWALAQPSTVQFRSSGVHVMRIQPRTAGVEFDQVVLSPALYLNGPPGSPIDDMTIVRR